MDHNHINQYKLEYLSVQAGENDNKKINKLGHHYLYVCCSACGRSSPYQLELPATIVGVLYTRVLPQSFNEGQVLQEDRRLQLPAGHLRRPGVKRHQAVPVLLVGGVTPRDVQLFPGVHQHTNTWTESGEIHFKEEDRRGRQVTCHVKE